MDERVYLNPDGRSVTYNHKIYEITEVVGNQFYFKDDTDREHVRDIRSYNTNR